MYRYLIRKNPKILLYLITSPLRAVSSVACAGALAAAIDYANGGQISQIGKYILVFSVYILADLLIDAANAPRGENQLIVSRICKRYSRI